MTTSGAAARAVAAGHAQHRQYPDAVAHRRDPAGRRLFLARPWLVAVAVDDPVRDRGGHPLVRRVLRPPLSPALSACPPPPSHPPPTPRTPRPSHSRPPSA